MDVYALKNYIIEKPEYIKQILEETGFLRFMTVEMNTDVQGMQEETQLQLKSISKHLVLFVFQQT
ncbi:hypothetical protein QKW52_22375 [Bacillus sonorensis]|nr:hypothetical protein [Bacillus sonorensis]